MSYSRNYRRTINRKMLDDLLLLPNLTWAEEVYQIVGNILDDLGFYTPDEAKATEALWRLPRGLRYLYHIFVLDSEVLNGGFWQFITNGHSADQALEALRAIGADFIAVMLNKAVLEYEVAKLKPETYNWHELRRLNKEYSELVESGVEEKLFGLLKTYAQSHPEEFIYE